MDLKAEKPPDLVVASGVGFTWLQRVAESGRESRKRRRCGSWTCCAATGPGDKHREDSREWDINPRYRLCSHDPNTSLGPHLPILPHGDQVAVETDDNRITEDLPLLFFSCKNTFLKETTLKVRKCLTTASHEQTAERSSDLGVGKAVFHYTNHHDLLFDYVRKLKLPAWQENTFAWSKICINGRYRLRNKVIPTPSAIINWHVYKVYTNKKK